MKKPFEYKSVALVLFIFCLVACAPGNGQTNQTPVVQKSESIAAQQTSDPSSEEIERELIAHIKAIREGANERNDSEKVSEANDLLKEKLLKYTKQASTLEYKFGELEKLLYIATSEDGNFRIYSWDTQGGGTMHFFETVYQYRDKNGAVYSKSAELPEGDAGSFVYDIFTLDLKDEKIYMACSNAILSTSDASQSINIFKIENDSLNDNVKLIKTRSGLQNSLGFEYDFFSVVDRPERPVKLILYDKSTRSIKIPLVLKDAKFQFGKVTDKFITYKFDGAAFVKVN